MHILTYIVTPFFVSCFFTETASTDIYTLSLHDALPISFAERRDPERDGVDSEVQILAHLSIAKRRIEIDVRRTNQTRSEEHTSELQSLRHLVCRLLLEKKKKKL